MWKIWLILAGVFIIIESMTVGFFVFWFAVGALIALIASLFIDNVIIQSAIFIISSTLLLILTKPLVKKFVKNNETIPTNVYSLIGKEALVIENINSIEGTGKVKVDGEIWSATADSNIEKDTKVKISSINGVKVKVEKNN